MNNFLDITDEIIKIATKKNITISTAESFTGGFITKSLTDSSGSSSVLVAGIVAYTLFAKEKFLGVKKETLDSYTAVSKETVREMCEGVQTYTNSTIGIATTGFAGPNDGENNGFCYIGFCIKSPKIDKTIHKEFHFTGDRNIVRLKATEVALRKTLEIIKEI